MSRTFLTGLRVITNRREAEYNFAGRAHKMLDRLNKFGYNDKKSIKAETSIIKPG